MGFRKHVLTMITAVVLVATNVGLVNLVIADMAEENEPGRQELAVTCDEAQEVIDNLDEHADSFGAIKRSIRITEDCRADLVIPSGKTVLLSLHSKDENGQDVYYHLTNDEGDTITVEEGASLYYEGSGQPTEYLANTAEGKAVINNFGKVHILSGTLKAESEALVIKNAGEFDVLGGDFAGKVQNEDSGRLRIANGTFDDVDGVKPFVIAGADMDEQTGGVRFIGDSIAHSPSQDYWPFEDGARAEVGATFTIRSNYPVADEMEEVKFSSADESILRVTGSNVDGWTVTVVGEGETRLGYSAIYQFGQIKVIGYQEPEEPPVVPAAACTEVQNLINSATDVNLLGYSEVRIADDCAVNLTIPSGKKIMLSLYSEYDDEDGHRQQQARTLTNNGDSDTITVERGATLLIVGQAIGGVLDYEGLPGSMPTIVNNANGKSAIRNYGTVRVGANLTAADGANLVTNSGTLYTIGGVYAGGNFVNVDDGRIHVAYGMFNNTGDVSSYVVNGMKLDSAGRVVSALPDGKSPLADYPYILSGKRLPIGYAFTLSKEYADLADAIEMNFGRSDESILKITGSNQEGWTFTVVGEGVTCAGQRAIYFAGDIGCMTGYVAPLGSEGTSESLTKKLVSMFLEMVKRAIDAGKEISLETRVEAKETVEEAEKTEIKKLLGEGKIAGYYDIDLFFKAGDEEEQLTDLEDESVDVRLATDFMNDLEEVESGYKRDYFVIRYHGGVAEKITARLDGDELVFQSGKFSTYAVAYVDTEVGTSGGSTSGDFQPDATITDTEAGPDAGTDDNFYSNLGGDDDNSAANAPDAGVASYFSSREVHEILVAVVGLVELIVIVGSIGRKVALKR